MRLRKLRKLRRLRKLRKLRKLGILRKLRKFRKLRKLRKLNDLRKSRKIRKLMKLRKLTKHPNNTHNPPNKQSINHSINHTQAPVWPPQVPVWGSHSHAVRARVRAVGRGCGRFARKSEAIGVYPAPALTEGPGSWARA